MIAGKQVQLDLSAINAGRQVVWPYVFCYSQELISWYLTRDERVSSFILHKTGGQQMNECTTQTHTRYGW
jgi:hypothetical protein